MPQATAARAKAEKEREAKRDALKRAATASASSRGATGGGAAGGGGEDDVESGDEFSSKLRSPGTVTRHGATWEYRPRSRPRARPALMAIFNRA